MFKLVFTFQMLRPTCPVSVIIQDSHQQRQPTQVCSKRRSSKKFLPINFGHWAMKYFFDAMKYFCQPVKYFCELMKYKIATSHVDPHRLEAEEEVAKSPGKKYEETCCAVLMVGDSSLDWPTSYGTIRANLATALWYLKATTLNWNLKLIVIQRNGILSQWNAFMIIWIIFQVI